jgi:hypothetical protein
MSVKHNLTVNAFEASNVTAAKSAASGAALP